jgi:hypothetical protein
MNSDTFQMVELRPANGVLPAVFDVSYSLDFVPLINTLRVVPVVTPED